MLINLECVAEAPSRRAMSAGSRQQVEFGLGGLLPVRDRGDLAAEAGWMSGTRIGGDSAAAGYVPELTGIVRPAQLAGNPVQAGTPQVSVVKKSTVQNSTYQHNTIQVTRLVPASRGGVGPHPGREPRPA